MLLVKTTQVISTVILSLITAGVDKKINISTAMILIITLLTKKNPLSPPRLAQNISTGLSRGVMTIFKLYNQQNNLFYFYDWPSKLRAMSSSSNF